jgi:putative ABC transport system permease protein
VIFKLVLENIRHKFMRTVLSVLLIAVPVTLILVIVGLSHGMVNDSKGRARGVGADIMIRPPGSNIMSFSSATIPEQLVPKLAGLPHVAAAMGTVNESAGALSDSMTGIDPGQMDRMSGGLTFVEGHGLHDPDDVLLDTYYAEQRHVKVGQSIKIGNHNWKVAGIVEPGKLSHIFCYINVLQDLYISKGLVSVVYLKLDDPRNTDTIIQELKATPGLKGYPIYSMEEVLDLISPDKVPFLSQFILVIIGISVVISFAVVALSMYMAVLQRTREIGILKAIGASRSFILSLIVAESLVVGFAGTVLGILFSFGTRALLLKLVPSSLPQAIVYDWWPRATAIVLAAALLGALYPGFSAARHDPIEALAYE